jgi:hypothetical protein
MKIFNKYIAALTTLVVSLSGCHYLDQMPDNIQNLDDVWLSRTKTEGYLYGIYALMPAEECISQSTCPWTWSSDEVVVTWFSWQKKNMSTTDGIYNGQWSTHYKGIRKTFVFENNVDKCFELTSGLKEQYKAEAKFLRGFFYWKLLQQFGPFVLLESEVRFNDDWKNFARAHYDTCVDYICRMMDEARENLPWAWEGEDEKWLGKPTKFACLAVKSEMLLMAASPQWNGNKEYAGFVNHDGSPLVDTEYKREKWEAAAAAALDVIRAAEENPRYGVRLYRNDEQNNGKEFNPYISVRDTQLAPWN